MNANCIGGKKSCLEDIVESSTIWDLTASSELGKLVLTSLIDYLISNLKKNENVAESESRRNAGAIPAPENLNKLSF